MDVRGSRDREIDRPAARLSTTGYEGSRESAPFTCHSSVDRERIERRFDDPESLRPQRPLVVGYGDQDPEVQFCERGDADRPLQLTWTFGPDQHRRIQKRTH